MTSTHDLLGYYLGLGFCVIPALPRSKRPSVEWKEYQSRKPTESELAEWRRLWGRGYNIAVVLGAISGNAVCIDFDNPELIRRLPIENLAKKTMVVLTGSDRIHVYVRTPEPIRTVKLPVGIEIRSEGSISILPPSTHPSGKPYVLLSKPGELADMVDPVGDLAEVFGVKVGSKPTAAKPVRARRFRRRPPCWDTLMKPGTIIYEGWRNEAITRVSSRLLQDGVGFEDAVERAWRWNLEHCVPPLPRLEVESAVRSVYRHGYAYGCTGLAPFCDVRNCHLYAREVRELLDFLGGKNIVFQSFRKNPFLFAQKPKKTSLGALKNSESEHPYRTIMERRWRKAEEVMEDEK
jgi:hypothetical protein